MTRAQEVMLQQVGIDLDGLQGVLSSLIPTMEDPHDVVEMEEAIEYIESARVAIGETGA